LTWLFSFLPVPHLHLLSQVHVLKNYSKQNRLRNVDRFNVETEGVEYSSTGLEKEFKDSWRDSIGSFFTAQVGDEGAN
jgi:hypothetical protein